MNTPRFLKVKDEPITPQPYFEDDFAVNQLRRSLSLSDVTAINNHRINIKQESCKKEVLERYYTPRKTLNELNRDRYLSLAEQIYHYERDTPERFHSNRKTIIPERFAQSLTKPQSPFLRAKLRTRPVAIPTREEVEQRELEEIRKYKIKANPVPKVVYSGSSLPHVEPKPATIPSPFKLTQAVKKNRCEIQEDFKFVAKPAPKEILENPQKLKRIHIMPTNTKTPVFVRKYMEEHRQNKQQTPTTANLKNCRTDRNGPLKPIPFSFDQRDEHLKIKREALKDKLLQEEQKQREFHARPLPKMIKNRLQSFNSSQAQSETASNTSSKENEFKFQAKPPKVLNQKPFKPVLSETKSTLPMPFDLSSEKRFQKRKEYDNKLQVKKEEQEKERARLEDSKRQAEQKAIAQLRAQIVHKAQPVPNFARPPTPVKDIRITSPKTPFVMYRTKKSVFNY